MNGNGEGIQIQIKVAKAAFYCTTFLKAHSTKNQTDKTLTLSAVATVRCALHKENQLNGWLRESGWQEVALTT